MFCYLRNSNYINCKTSSFPQAKDRHIPQMHFMLLKGWAKPPKINQVALSLGKLSAGACSSWKSEELLFVSTGHRSWRGQNYLLRLSILSLLMPFNSTKVSWFIDKLEIFKRRDYSFIKWLFYSPSTEWNCNIKIFIRPIKLERLWKFLSLKFGILKKWIGPIFCHVHESLNL